MSVDEPRQSTVPAPAARARRAGLPLSPMSERWAIPAAEQIQRLTEMLGRLRALRRRLIAQQEGGPATARAAERAAILALLDAAITTTEEMLAGVTCAAGWHWEA